jgi:hypothetical protein
MSKMSTKARLLNEREMCLNKLHTIQSKIVEIEKLETLTSKKRSNDYDDDRNTKRSKFDDSSSSSSDSSDSSDPSDSSDSESDDDKKHKKTKAIVGPFSTWYVFKYVLKKDLRVAKEYEHSDNTVAKSKFAHYIATRIKMYCDKIHKKIDQDDKNEKFDESFGDQLNYFKILEMNLLNLDMEKKESMSACVKLMKNAIKYNPHGY